MPKAIGVGIVHVKVPDADLAQAFYAGLLGWESERFTDAFTAHYVRLLTRPEIANR